MSQLSEMLKFEKFNLKDIWEHIKKNPERLLLGAVEPAGSKLWGSVLGKDYEPMVDQWGGAYGGSPDSSGDNKDSGVYKRAEAAGIDTGAGGGMQDLAHAIAKFYAGNYASSQLGFNPLSATDKKKEQAPPIQQASALSAPAPAAGSQSTASNSKYADALRRLMNAGPGTGPVGPQSMGAADATSIFDGQRMQNSALDARGYV